MTTDFGRHHLPDLDEPARQVRVQYQRWLDDVDDELVGGALLVRESLPRVTRAFLLADRGCIDEARAMANDVTGRCRRVEDEGFLLLAREAPVAGDLRRLVAILRLVFAVERSASLLRHVAETVDRFDPRFLPDPVRRMVQELAERSGDVFGRGIDAWRHRDALAIHDVDELDSAVDRLRDRLLEVAEQEMEGSAELLLLGLLARYYERIADHGVAFAQHATFSVTGERVAVGP
jgi:phosphate transport system protein